jgi:hypothetical protein
MLFLCSVQADRCLEESNDKIVILSVHALKVSTLGPCYTADQVYLAFDHTP